MSATSQLTGRQQVILNFDVTPELEGVYSCVNNNVTSGNSVELIGEWASWEETWTLGDFA